MAWTAPRTWITGEVVTAALLNAHVRDNLLESAPATVTTAGDIVYADGVNNIVRLAAGTDGTFLTGGTVPAWSNSITDRVVSTAAIPGFRMSETDNTDPADYWEDIMVTGNRRSRYWDDSAAAYVDAQRLPAGNFGLHSGDYGNGVGAVHIVSDTAGGPTALVTTGAILLDALALVTGGAAYVEGFWMVVLERTSAASVSGVQIIPRQDGTNLSTHFNFGSGNTGIATVIPAANDIHTFTGSFFRRVTASDTSDYEIFISADDNSRFQFNAGFLYVRSIQYPT